MSRRFMPWFGQAAFAVALAGAASAAPAQHSQGLVLDDAERFALLLQSHDLPTASQLQSAYLDPGSAGVRIFTPHRIRDATTLAEAVAKDPEAYRRALHLCLPVAQRLQAEATDIAHRISALLGSSGPVPVYVVLGAGNSGGTASAQGLVLGLEVICRQATDASAAHQLLKDFIAHELVHVHQLRAGTEQSSSDLLRQSLVEGFRAGGRGFLLGASHGQQSGGAPVLVQGCLSARPAAPAAAGAYSDSREIPSKPPRAAPPPTAPVPM